MRQILFSILAGLLVQGSLCGAAVLVQDTLLVVDNGLIRRVINHSGNKVILVGLWLNESERNFVLPGSPEFRFLMNENIVDASSGWNVIDIKSVTENTAEKSTQLKLTGSGPATGMEIGITYTTYPDLPLIRKKISFRNNTDEDIKIESPDIECLRLNFDYVSTWVYHNYARMKSLGTYTGNWDDPVVVIHNTTLRSGIALGNEAPGVLKRTVFHTTDRNADIGMTHRDQDFPFRKWLKPGETWEAPPVFIAIYSGTDDGYEVVNTTVNDFVRKYLGSRITAIKDKPLFIYNTWYPFRTFISDSLIRRIAKAASECGIQEFIIDDGWEYNFGRKSASRGWGENYGDWLIDMNKFPEDLSSTFRYIKSLGMKPGLWISIGSATSDSKVLSEHPEWFVINSNGKTGNLHYSGDGGEFATSCFGTEWVSYIKSKILELVREHGLAYAKLDLSVVTSAYINNAAQSGCYATDHPYHRDHEESFIAIYQNVLRLFDELHAEAPSLFIDCTFETAGKLQLQDYAFVKHAEGNWLSNIEEPSPTGALRMRQLAWWRSPAVPAGSLVIGNLPLDSKDLEFDLKSLLGSLPVLLGDPSKLTSEQRSDVKKWAQWMVRMQEKYDYMSFRQDLPGFGEPAEGRWDGWSRINTDTRSGGIAGIFRQGAAETSRVVTLKGLDPTAVYSVHIAPEGPSVFTGTGKKLEQEGFPVTLRKAYSGEVFEIRLEK